MFDLECCVAFVTNQASKKLADAFGDRLRPHGITRAQWIALYYLDRRAPISQRDLASLINVQASSLTRLLDRMERDGLVARDRSPRDKRVLLVSLTEQGREKLRALLSVGEETSRAFARGISESDMETFKRVIARMTENCR